MLLGDGVADVFAPDEHGVSCAGSQNDVFSGTNELPSLSTVFVVIAAVVAQRRKMAIRIMGLFGLILIIYISAPSTPNLEEMWAIYR